jgi:hypothetical protein
MTVKLEGKVAKSSISKSEVLNAFRSISVSDF